MSDEICKCGHAKRYHSYGMVCLHKSDQPPRPGEPEAYCGCVKFQPAEQMVRCPKWRTCNILCPHKFKDGHKPFPHYAGGKYCDTKDTSCPACVPVTASPERKQECSRYSDFALFTLCGYSDFALQSPTNEPEIAQSHVRIHMPGDAPDRYANHRIPSSPAGKPEPAENPKVSSCCLAGLITLSASHLTKQSPVNDYPKCEKCGKICVPVPASPEIHAVEICACFPHTGDTMGICPSCGLPRKPSPASKEPTLKEEGVKMKEPAATENPYKHELQEECLDPKNTRGACSLYSLCCGCPSKRKVCVLGCPACIWQEGLEAGKASVKIPDHDELAALICDKCVATCWNFKMHNNPRSCPFASGLAAAILALVVQGGSK